MGFRKAVSVWTPAVVTAGLSILAQLARWQEALRYDRLRVGEGEVWRLLTAHVAHLGWSHLVMNLAGLLVMTALFRDVIGAFAWSFIAIVAALAVGAGLYLFAPGVSWYVGLSGVLHGMLAAGAFTILRRERVLGGGLLLFLVLKLAWEQVAGPLPGSESAAGGTVIVQSHLYGALAGLVAGVVTAVARRAR